MYGIANVPCFYRLRDGVVFGGKGKRTAWDTWIAYCANNLECVNQTWKQLFTQKGRSIEGIPPTKASLIQLTKRATYQAGYCWGQVMIAAPELPSPNEWGWTRKEHKWFGSMIDNSARSYKGL